MINTEEIKIKSFNKEAQGRKLVMFAWVIEVVAIVIGLSIGISTTLIGIEKLGSNLIENISFAAAALGPFLAFAACELAKIPTAKGLYISQGWTMKALCLVMLSFFAVLTFETIYQGMEQNISARLAEVQEIKGGLADKNEKIVTIDKDIKSFTEKGITETGRKIVNLNEMEIRKNKLKLDLIKSKYQDNISIVEKETSLEILLIQDSIKGLTDQINHLDKSELAATQGTMRKAKIKKAFEERRKPLRATLSKQRLNLEELRTNKRLRFQQLEEEYVVKRSPIDQKTSEQREVLDNYEATSLDKAAQNEKKIEELQTERSNLMKETQDLRKGIFIVANSNPVYRVAMSFSSVEHPADLPNEIVDIVGNIWIISISIMTAVAGSVLAFVGVSMQEDRVKKSKEKRMPSKISKTVRSMLIDARRKLRSPKIVIEKQEIEVEKVVEVIKEVPVEKVVIQEKEVEVEKIITRVIGVPVPTHPKDLPTAEEIDDETEAERLIDLQEITSIGELAHA